MTEDREAGSELAVAATMGAASSSTQIALMREDTTRPVVFLDDRRLIHARMTDRRILNQFRNVRTQLLQRSAGGNAVTLVTAIGDGADAAVTALNLAISFALDSTKTALVIDCNIHDPVLDRVLDVEVGLGLTDYLMDDSVDMEAILYQTGIARLRLIPAGSHLESGAEFFTSARMKLFLQAVKLRYPDRFIVLHAPPLDASADSRILAEICDMTVLVAGYGEVSESRMMEAANVVGRERLAGIVLSQVPIVPFLNR
jgi:protein-tyrosine kinase